MKILGNFGGMDLIFCIFLPYELMATWLKIGLKGHFGPSPVFREYWLRKCTNFLGFWSQNPELSQVFGLRNPQIFWIFDPKA